MNKIEEKPRNTDRDLKNPRISTLILDDIGPTNPYGPNYSQLPFDTKLYYKWLRMKKYIHLKPLDQEEHIRHNYIYYGSLFASGFMMYGLAYLSKNYVLVKHFPRVYDVQNDMPAIYYGLWISYGVSKALTTVQTYHIKEFIIPNLEKYLDEGKENGFADYKISPTVGSLGIIDRIKIAYS